MIIFMKHDLFDHKRFILQKPEISLYRLFIMW